MEMTSRPVRLAAGSTALMLILGACSEASSRDPEPRPTPQIAAYRSEVVNAGYDDYAWVSVRLTNIGTIPVLPLIKDCTANFFDGWEPPIAWVRLPRVIEPGESDVVRIRSHVTDERWREIREVAGGQAVDAEAECSPKSRKSK